MNVRRTAFGRAAFIATVALVGAGFAPGGAHAADSLKITVGGAAVVDFNAATEATQSFSALQVAAFPEGFKPGTLYLIEPAAEGAGSELTSLGGMNISNLHVSDALSLNGALGTGKFNVFFISDGAGATDRNAFPIFGTVTMMTEGTGPMDVSSVFGFPTGSIIVQSDAIPEPAAWAMMLIGFGGLGVVLRRRRAHAGLQMA
jgi:hypothetical protein